MTDPRPVDPHKTVTVTRDVTRVVTLGVPGATSGTGITQTEKDTINGRLTTLEGDVNVSTTEVSTADVAKVLKAPTAAGVPTYAGLAINDLSNVNAPTPAANNTLIYDSGTAQWIPAAPATSSSTLTIVSPVIPGRYYTPAGLLGLQSAQNTNIPATNNAYLVPVMFDRDGTIDQIGLWLQAVGPTGSTVRMTIYSAGTPHNRPDVKLLATSPAAVSMTTTGIKTFTVSLAVVKNTVYYLAMAAVFASGTPGIAGGTPARDWYGPDTAGDYSRFGMYVFTQAAGWTEFSGVVGGPVVPYSSSIFTLSARLV